MENPIVEEAPSAISGSRNESVKQKRKRSGVDPADNVKSGAMSESLITEATPKKKNVAKKSKKSVSNASSNCHPEEENCAQSQETQEHKLKRKRKKKTNTNKSILCTQSEDLTAKKKKRKTKTNKSILCTQSQAQNTKKRKRKRNKSISIADTNWKPESICSPKGSHLGGNLSISQEKKASSIFNVDTCFLYTRKAENMCSPNASNKKSKKKNKSGPAHHDRELSEGKKGNNNSLPKKIRSSIFNVDSCFDYNRTTEVSKNVQSSIFKVDTAFKDRKTDDVISNAQSKFVPEQKDVILPTPTVKEAGPSNRKLLILDLNGLLADVCSLPTPGFQPDTRVSGKAVYKRPFCEDFLQFCFETFDVGVWSSRMRRNVDSVVHCLMGDTRSRLIFCWDAYHCTQTGCQTIGNRQKPLVLKELTKLWEMEFPGLPWKKGAYNESNTLLIDDSPYKALRNPPNTAIFPSSYVHTDIKDNSLGPDGDLRLYLTRLAAADNVQEFVAANPFGQNPITNSDPSWTFYSAIQNSNSQS